jgi:hypothetical protein
MCHSRHKTKGHIWPAHVHFHALLCRRWTDKMATKTKENIQTVLPESSFRARKAWIGSSRSCATRLTGPTRTSSSARPPEQVSAWQMSAQDKCPYMTNASTWQMPVHDKCPYMTNARTWQMPVHDKCQCMTNTRAGQMPAQDKCPYMTNAHTGQNVSAWQMSVHDKCPHMTTALTWQLPSHDKCPYMTNVSAWQMPVHDKCQCITNGGCGQIGLNFRNRKYHPNANICYFSKNVNPSRGHGRAQH